MCNGASWRTRARVVRAKGGVVVSSQACGVPPLCVVVMTCVVSLLVGLLARRPVDCSRHVVKKGELVQDTGKQRTVAPRDTNDFQQNCLCASLFCRVCCDLRLQ